MQIQFASFSLPLYPNSDEEEHLNRFLRSHTIMLCHTQFLPDQGGRWAVLVQYGIGRPPEDKPHGKVDYKEVLSVEDFALFDKLRQARKRLSEAEGVPPYAVCTNEQLSQLAVQKPSTKAAFQSIEGLGQAKAEKYAQALLDVLAEQMAKSG
jgi:superfamily II DNA helicase RecQ